jgi:hypothetical protein
MARVTGIGGVFFKSRNDKAALAAWYQKHLGMPLESWGGAILRWPDDRAEDKGLTVWHVAEKESQWFSPSDSTFMINYRVDNLGELIAKLREDGVEIISGPDSHENGKFAWDHGPGGEQSGAVGADDLGRKEQERVKFLLKPLNDSFKPTPLCGAAWFKR